MLDPETLILIAAIVSLGLGRWNFTSLVLGAAYFIVEGWAWLASPRYLAPADLFLVDIFIILAITLKTIHRHPRDDYGTAWEHLKMFLASPTFCDRLILGVFVFAVWPAYVLNLAADPHWYLLWGAAMAQFVIAGGESLHRRRSAKAPLNDQDNPSSGLMKVAWARAGPWST